MVNNTEIKQQTAEETHQASDQQESKAQSKIISTLFKKVEKENSPSTDEITPKAHYVKGAHTSGVYHKHYNRY